MPSISGPVKVPQIIVTLRPLPYAQTFASVSPRLRVLTLGDAENHDPARDIAGVILRASFSTASAPRISAPAPFTRVYEWGWARYGLGTQATRQRPTNLHRTRTEQPVPPATEFERSDNLGRADERLRKANTPLPAPERIHTVRC